MEKLPLACPKCLMPFPAIEGADLKCPGCGAVYVFKNGVYEFGPMPAGVKGDKIAEPQNPASWSPWRQRNYDYLSGAAKDLASGARVLDLGAGEQHFRNLFPQENYIAADFYPYPGVRVVTDLTRRLPFQNNSFDCVLLSNVLEHMPEPVALLGECARVLAPSGRIIITVPFIIKLHQTPFDFYRYTRFALERLLGCAGFKNILVTDLGGERDLIRTFLGAYAQSLDADLNARIRLRLVRIFLRLIFQAMLGVSRFIISVITFLAPRRLTKVGSYEAYVQGYGVIANKF